jgi:formate dehydrogenase maturation protein FdhE
MKNEITMDITEDNLNEAMENDGKLVVQLSLDEEIELLQSIDKKELSGMIPSLHEQGLNYEQLKENITTEAQLKINLPEIDNNLIEELSDFFKSLDNQVQEFRNN